MGYRTFWDAEILGLKREFSNDFSHHFQPSLRCITEISGFRKKFHETRTDVQGTPLDLNQMIHNFSVLQPKDSPMQ